MDPKKKKNVSETALDKDTLYAYRFVHLYNFYQTFPVRLINTFPFYLNAL